MLFAGEEIRPLLSGLKSKLREGHMTLPVVNEKPKGSTTFYLRTLSKSGGTRYLSVGTILPPEWQHVKVFVLEQNSNKITLLLERIK